MKTIREQNHELIIKFLSQLQGYEATESNQAFTIHEKDLVHKK